MLAGHDVPDRFRYAGLTPPRHTYSFGLLGHLLEIAKGSGAGARLDWKSIPLLPDSLEFAREGMATWLNRYLLIGVVAVGVMLAYALVHLPRLTPLSCGEPLEDDATVLRIG